MLEPLGDLSCKGHQLIPAEDNFQLQALTQDHSEILVLHVLGDQEPRLLLQTYTQQLLSQRQVICFV